MIESEREAIHLLVDDYHTELKCADAAAILCESELKEKHKKAARDILFKIYGLFEKKEADDEEA